MPRELRALRSAPPVFGVAEAERIARELYGLAVSASPLSGERDCNFRLRTADGHDYVLKVVDGAADPQATDCQIQVLRHLWEQDPSLPVPRSFATQSGTDLGVIQRDTKVYSTYLLGYLSGQLLADLKPTRSMLKSVGCNLARIDLALRGFGHAALSQPIAWDVRRLPELIEYSPYIEVADIRRSVELVCAGLRERLTALRGLRSQAIHGDCHPGNILMDAARPDTVSGLLDFGDMIHAPKILEAAVAMSELLTQGLSRPNDLAAVLEGFTADQPLEKGDVAVLFDLVTARHAVTLMVHAWRSRHDIAGARVLDEAASLAARSLLELLAQGRAALTEAWHDAAGTSSSPVTLKKPVVELARRRRLMGAGAELFYDPPLHFVRGDGLWLYDARGRAYLDVYNNVPHVGHCHPAVVRAIQRQTATLVTHTRYLHGSILDYAEALTAYCPKPLDTCIFVNSGSEANDVAWRMAQHVTGHQGAVVMAHAYHGITDAVSALTPGAGQPSDPRVVALQPPPAGLTENSRMTDEDLGAVAENADCAVRTLAARGFAPAAFYLDSALTSTGIFDPPPVWLETITARLREAGCLIVADEVQYGLGRSGSHFWGFGRRGQYVPGSVPDIVTLGKPVGNGYPMGVVIANRARIEAFQGKFGFFSTFGGNPVAAAAGLAVLEVLDRERLKDNARETGAYLRRQLRQVADRHECLGSVRGAGLLLGLEVRGADQPSARARTLKIVNTLASRDRVLIGSEGPAGNILKLRPPMTFRREHADLLAQSLDSAAAL